LTELRLADEDVGHVHLNSGRHPVAYRGS
jgi:hypothetical protein